jgi:hypothetical protein
MQLFCETADVQAAIEELKIAIPIAALQNVIEHRVAAHRPRGALRRRLEMLKALQIAEETAA